MSGCVSGWKTRHEENYPVCIIYDKIRYDIKKSKIYKDKNNIFVVVVGAVEMFEQAVLLCI